jgi:uncharacterized protein YjiS (DUF1127 family)
MLAIEMIRRAWSVVERILRRQRERHKLLELDNRTLRDIGISREDAVREGGKPMWRA